MSAEPVIVPPVTLKVQVPWVLPDELPHVNPAAQLTLNAPLIIDTEEPVVVLTVTRPLAVILPERVSVLVEAALVNSEQVVQLISNAPDIVYVKVPGEKTSGPQLIVSASV